MSNGISPYSACIFPDLVVLTTDPLLYIGASLMASASDERNMLRGFAFGRLAVRIIEKESVPEEVACLVYNFFASHIMPWHRPLVEAQRYFLAAISNGLETYNITLTSTAVIDRAVFSFFSGESLDLVEAKLEEAEPLIAKGKETGKHWLSLPMQLVRSLRGIEPPDETFLDGQSDSSHALLKAQTNHSHTHLFTYHCYQLILAVFNGRTDIGMTSAKACEIYLASAIGSILSGMYNFYSAVLFVDCLDKLEQSDVTLLKKKMDSLRLWSKTAQSTFEHKYKFVKTMMSRTEKNQLAVLDDFDEAIHLALESGLIQDAALYAERCSSWLRESAPNRSAQYLSFARRQYDFWGATSKVTEIRKIQVPNTNLRGFGNPSLDALMIAIFPSPANEFKDPFSRGVSDDQTSTNPHSPPTSLQTPRSARDSRVFLQTTSDGVVQRPPLRTGNSTNSINSVSSIEESRRKASILATSSSPQNSDISSELDLQSVMRASLAIQEGPHVKNIILKLVHIIMQTAGADYGCVMLRDELSERKALYIEVVGNCNDITLVDHILLRSQTDVTPARLCEYTVSKDKQLIVGPWQDLENLLSAMEIHLLVTISSTLFMEKIRIFGLSAHRPYYVCQSQSSEVH